MDFRLYPHIIYRVIYVPVRDILEPLGYTVTWDESQSKAICKKTNSPILVFDVQNHRVTKEDRELLIKEPIILEKNRILVPVIPLVEELDYWVQWNPEMLTLNINQFEWDKPQDIGISQHPQDNYYE